MLFFRSILYSLVPLILLYYGVTRSDDTTRVVATFSILGDMVDRIGGEFVSLETLVGPDGDTHVYQPTPAAARMISDADILIFNG